MIPDLDRVLDAGYLANLGDVDTEHLRSMRSECADLENGVSYVRRLAQGRLDLLSGVDVGAGGDAVADLVARLPELLSDGVRAPGSGRVVEELDPLEEVVDPLTERLDAVAGPAVLGAVADRDQETLTGAIHGLRALEDELSEARRTLHSTIDTLNDELARRIADDGAAS